MPANAREAVGVTQEVADRARPSSTEAVRTPNVITKNGVAHQVAKGQSPRDPEIPEVPDQSLTRKRKAEIRPDKVGEP